MTMISLIIKQCRRCGTTFYDGERVIKLEPGVTVTVVQAKLSQCQHCPTDIEPRELSRRVF